MSTSRVRGVAKGCKVSAGGHVPTVFKRIRSGVHLDSRRWGEVMSPVLVGRSGHGYRDCVGLRALGGGRVPGPGVSAACGGDGPSWDGPVVFSGTSGPWTICLSTSWWASSGPMPLLGSVSRRRVCVCV